MLPSVPRERSLILCKKPHNCALTLGHSRLARNSMRREWDSATRPGSRDKERIVLDSGIAATSGASTAIPSSSSKIPDELTRIGRPALMPIRTAALDDSVDG